MPRFHCPAPLATGAEIDLPPGAARHVQVLRLQGVVLNTLPFLILRAPVHLMLNARTTSAADLARLNSAITRLEQRGALAAIRNSYEAP